MTYALLILILIVATELLAPALAEYIDRVLNRGDR